MSNIYLDSSKVFVFPYSKVRHSNADSGRLLYEENLVSMTKQFLYSNGFIINAPSSLAYDSGKLCVRDTLEFNIGGYYFKIDSDSSLCEMPMDDGSYVLKAHIILTSTNGTWELKGQDAGSGEDYKFYGLILTIDNQSVLNDELDVVDGEMLLTLPLYKFSVSGRKLSSSELHKESLYKYRVEDINITRIDGRRTL